MWPTRQPNGPTDINVIFLCAFSKRHRRQHHVCTNRSRPGLQLGDDDNHPHRWMRHSTDVPRAHGEDAAFDLWGKNGTGLPATAVPVLVHEVFCEIEWFEQIIWFNRTETRDELWTFTDLDLDIRRSLNDVRASTRPGGWQDSAGTPPARYPYHAHVTMSESLLELPGLLLHHAGRCAWRHRAPDCHRVHQ